MTRKPETFSWVDFAKTFYVCFFPRTTKMEFDDRFSSLYQDGMSVADYYARFVQLVRFTPYCDIPNEAASFRGVQRSSTTIHG